MWLAFPIAFVVAHANVASSTSEPRVLVLDLARGQGINDDEAKTVGELLTASFSARQHLKIITHDDIRQLAALAANRAQAGCDDNACLAEIAGALSADYVVSGRVSRLADLVVLQLSLFDAKAGAATARSIRKLPSVRALADAMDPAVDELLAGIASSSPSSSSHDAARAIETTRAAASSGPSTPALALLGVGAAGAVVAVGAGVVGELSLGEPASMTLAQYQSRQAIALTTVGISAVVAVVAGAAGGVMWGLGS